MSDSSRISSASRKVMEALADTIIPGGDDERPGALDINLVDLFLEFLSQFRPAPRLFVMTCWMWEFCPIWSGRLARFSRLSLEERTTLLESWEQSRFLFRRGALLLLKALFMAAFYNNEAVWSHIGYDGGCLSEPPNPIEDKVE